MIWFYESDVTIIIMIISFIIVTCAQIKIKSAYSKYKKVQLNNNLSGMEVARKILDSNGLENIYVVETSGSLSDHYDPTRKVIRLSSDVFHGTTISAAAVAAHECGHAIQDKVEYVPMKIRSFLVPVVNFVTYIGYIGLFISLLGGITGYIKLSILILLATLLFQIITLPVEYNASNRANNELLRLGIINNNEINRIKTVLKAAALTYVASLISTLLSILRLIVILRDRD